MSEEFVRLSIILSGFIIGASLGSFAKALADRSLKDKSFRGRSYCVKCQHPLNWYDLFPVFSYILLKGKCRYCHKRIGIEYLIIEVLTGVLVGFLFWQQFNNFQFSVFNLNSNFKFQILNFQIIQILADLLFKTFFITVLIALFLTDLKKMFIPDRIVIPSIWITLTFLLALTIYKIGFLYYALLQTSLGQLLLPPHSDYFQRHALMLAQPLFAGVLMAVLIGGFFTLLIIITRGKGMGGGDVKLGALMGASLGFPNSILALMMAFFSGAVLSLLLILIRRKNFKSVVPFGPFLVLGSLIALFWGDQLIDWYLNFSFKLGS